MRAGILIGFMAAAFGQQADTPSKNGVASGAPRETSHPAVASKVQAAAAKPFSAEEENDIYSFAYGWSAEAAAIPQLVKRFTEEMAKAKAELDASAREDRDERRKEGFDFLQYATQVSYVTSGQSDRLLSLESAVYSFTGGAHGSSGSGAVLWDRQEAREVGIPQLLRPGQSWTGAIRRPFCVLLDREREERREEPVTRNDMFGDCPKYGDLTVVLSDGDQNGLFDHIKVIADQYVAGPYAEGPYEILLPVTSTMIDRLKPEYRGSFEPRTPVS